MNASNTFSNGLVMDTYPLATSNDILTNCLNGTLITYNGNELILQNDIGNSRIPDGKNYVKLKDDYVPIGLKEFGGILYIFSTNPKTDDCEIGSFPSPDYNNTTGKLEYIYRPFHNLRKDKNSSLQDFNTKLLNFDVNHPLEIDCQKSYDGTVNLIFTDNKNRPRIVNSRFSVFGESEYQLIDRTGDDDTNIYNLDTFEFEVALNKIVNSIVKINFDGIQTGGNLMVGTYTFYFTLADSDNNESDFVGQSSLVACYKGNLNDPKSVDGGVEDENSYKMVKFTLSNIPRQFSRIYVYYSRNSSDASGVAVTTYHKLDKYFTASNGTVSFFITGYEQTLTVSQTTINTNYLTIGSAKSQAMAQNILFYANVKSSDETFMELADYAKTIDYEFITDRYLGNVTGDFVTHSGSTQLNGKTYDTSAGYYNPNNIYHFVGYWPTELYRFGVVFILDDYSLSPVYNMKGGIETKGDNEYGIIRFPRGFDLNNIKPLGIRFKLTKEAPSKVKGYFFVRQKRLKTILAQGVRIGSDQDFSYLPLLYKFKMTDNGHEFQMGWFTEGFLTPVQQITSIDGGWYYDFKNNTWTIGEGTSGTVDQQHVFSGLYPQSDYSTKAYLKLSPSFIGEEQVLLTASEFYIKPEEKGEKMYQHNAIVPDAMIVPEYEVNQAYFNQLFTGGKLQYEKIGDYHNFDQLSYNKKIFITSDFHSYNLNKQYDAYVIGVPENTPAVKAKKKVYSSLAGSEADGIQTKTPFINYRIIFDAKKTGEIDGVTMEIDNADVTWKVRGIWGPYVGIENEDNAPNSYVYDVDNILIPNYSDLTKEELEITRRDDKSEFYAISDRFEITNKSVECFRGDCFVCNFGHVMNRNFIDPSFPINTEIADTNCWYKACRVDLDTQNTIYQTANDGSDYKVRSIAKQDVGQNKASVQFLNRSDVNAVDLGHTFITKVYSSQNLCIRSTDGSHITERATFGQVRSFYPLRDSGYKVSNKLPDSQIFNGGYEKSLGEQYYVAQVDDIPTLNSNHQNRIIHSEIEEKGSFSNNLRVFKQTSFTDYTRQYGEIVKILNLKDQYLFIVFEHALGVVTVKEKAIATQSSSGFAYIDTAHVLSDSPTFLTTDYGSQWADSVIQTPTGIYGVDTVAKKIWVYGSSFEALSDFKVQKFLKDCLTLDENDVAVDVTKLNVKTHFNKHKQDIMFTFYRVKDNDFIGWNICYNEITKKFTTFYSWIPSYSGNINNTFYSFDAEVSMKDNLKLHDTYFENIDDQNDKTHNYLWEHNRENNWCHWYGEQHPFEFEFICADKPQIHKIFNNLQMVANKTKPESFHFEVIGEDYNFKHDKKNMYYRQERTKEWYGKYQNCNISYDEDYTDIKPELNQKSVVFPLAVSRVDRKNKIYDVYQRMTSPNKDYQGFSGSEIVYDRTTNDFNVATHVKARPLDGYEWVKIGIVGDDATETAVQSYKTHGVEVRKQGEYWEKKVTYGRRLGNCHYKEDQWYIQIPAINFYEKNENWKNIPPISILANPVPEDIPTSKITMPADTDLTYWSSLKQTRPRDKYIKIKVRYSGDDLAIISAIITQYKESYN